MLPIGHYLGEAERKEQALIVDIAKAVKELPGYSEGTVRKLMQIDRGPKGGNMVTLGLALAVRNREHYVMNETGLKVSKELFALDLEVEPKSFAIPPYVEVEAKWCADLVTSGEGNNILGDNGQLFLKEKNLSIPTVRATNETLNYYGASLIEKGATIRFPDPVYPLFQMHIGKNYVEEFIYTQAGGGFYLEYHEDQPHFHMPLKGDGHYLLARWNGSKLQMTAFEIPEGTAVYTRKGAIHCDAGLKGDWIVGYTMSETCSTVLLRTKESEMVTVNFCETKE